MSTASPIAAGNGVKVSLHDCLRRVDQMAGRRPWWRQPTYHYQAISCACVVCVHRPAGSARSYARRPASSPDLLIKFLVTGYSAHSCSGSSVGPPKEALSETTWTRVDLLSHYCHVSCTYGGRRCARGSTGAKWCYHLSLQRMNRNGMGSERQSRQSFDEHASETAVTSTSRARVFQ
jgi:hypothetical protein